MEFVENYEVLCQKLISSVYLIVCTQQDLQVLHIKQTKNTCFVSIFVTLRYCICSVFYIIINSVLSAT